MSFLKSAIELVGSPSHSRTIGFLIILLILAVVPLTVLVAQQQQEIRQRAEYNQNQICTDVRNECNFNSNQLNPPCGQGQEGKRCKLNNIVFECQKE